MPLRLLLIERSVDAANRIVERLRGGGLDVIVRHLSDLQELAVALPEEQWNIVLSGDLAEPDDIQHALQSIRRAGLDIPFVIVSDRTDAEAAVEAIRDGAHDFVHKDNLGRLPLAVQRALADYEDRRARAEAEAALRRSEAKYRALFEESYDTVYITTADGRILDINKAGARLFGYGDSDEIPDSLNVSTFYADPKERASMLAQLTRQGFVKDCELHLRDRHGVPIVVRQTATAVCEEETGKLVAIRGFLRDVSTERELELQLRQAQKMEAVGTLASGIAHDFNNLLTAILGYTDLAMGCLPPNHSAVDSLKMVEVAARQATSVTKSLLTFSRKTVGEVSPLKLNRVLADWIRLLRRVLPASVEIVEEIDHSTEVWVRGDAVQLQQVVMNLAVNARDAMPEGGIFRISLEAEPIADTSGLRQAVLAVEDTGVGMAEETQSRIFEPFFTTKSRGRGTGLGMSVIHGIVTAHRGEIAIESHEGWGTRVIITMPCCEPEGIPENMLVPGSRKQGEGERILVVEDDAHIRSIVVSVLRSARYNVVDAGDGIEGESLMRVAGNDVRLVVLDLDLPRKPGRALLREIRNMRSGIPVVAITGSVTDDVEDWLEDHECLLRKPFQMSELVVLVGRMLARSGAAEGSSAN